MNGGSTRSGRRLGDSIVARSLCAVVLSVCVSGSALAQQSTTLGSSIVMFPLLRSDGVYDSFVQITNNSNLRVHLRCFYVAAATCQSTVFSLTLTRQQPTGWRLSRGRAVRKRDSDQGIDPGEIPAVPAGFSGSLTCYQTDDAGDPFGANSLLGVATLQSESTGDIAKYDAVGLRADFLSLDQDQTLCLGAAPSAACPNGAEYDACPMILAVEQSTDDAEDPVAGPGSRVRTEIALMPCTFNYDTDTHVTVGVTYSTTNEFELPLSVDRTMGCWQQAALVDLDSVFSADVLGSERFLTRMRSSTATGVVGAALATRTGATQQAVAIDAVDLIAIGERSEGDVIVIPPAVVP